MVADSGDHHGVRVNWIIFHPGILNRQLFIFNIGNMGGHIYCCAGGIRPLHEIVVNSHESSKSNPWGSKRKD